MRALVVGPPELPGYDMVASWNMVGFKSTANNVTADDYLEGAEYARIYGFRNGAWFLIPGRPYDDPMELGLG